MRIMPGETPVLQTARALPMLVQTKIKKRGMVGHFGARRALAVACPERSRGETIFAKPVISGNSRKSRPLFTCQRALSTSNGRAARQGYQGRNIFSKNRTGRSEITKTRGAFHFPRAARLALLCAFCASVAQSCFADDMNTIRDRFIAAVVPREGEPAKTFQRAAHQIAEAQQPDGSWGDIDYADKSRSVWKSVKHLN